MDFGFDETTLELRERLLAFMDECVHPAEARFREQVERSADSPWDTPPVIEELKVQARDRGLWNLFLPAMHEHGAGLTNLQYAPLAEITGRSPWIAPEALNCSAPDTGNMELLSLFGTPEQKARWLEPLLDGRIRSAFSMTEPDVASSDATQHRDAHRTRRRPLRRQRAQVVDVGSDVAALRAADRHGRHRSGRRAAPAPEHDPGPEGHAGRRRRALDEPLRLRRRAARRARRDRLRRRARAGREPARCRGRGLPAGAGTARAGPHPPCDAGDRDGRARAAR